MDDAEAEARGQRERLEAAEIFAFILPVLDRLLLIDVRQLPEHAPGVLLTTSEELVREFVPRFQRQLGDLFVSRPELLFGRLRLFAYLDGELAQLVVEAALALRDRPPVDRAVERRFAYARVRTTMEEFFGSPVWALVEETVQRKSASTLGDQLAAARQELVTWERQLKRRAEDEERRRLFSDRYYKIIRPEEPPGQ